MGINFRFNFSAGGNPPNFRCIEVDLGNRSPLVVIVIAENEGVFKTRAGIDPA